MKRKQFVCLTLATAFLASSCTSSYQAAGGVTGAMIGSHVGGAVGVLSVVRVLHWAALSVWVLEPS